MRNVVLGFVPLALALAAACGGDDPAGQNSSSSSSGGSPSEGGASSSSSSSSSGGGDGGTGANCTSDDECESRCVAGACTTPTHQDGKRSPSLGETDVDCGGPTAPACAEGLACAADGDCTTSVCSATQRCVPAASCRGVNGPAGVDTCGAGETGADGAAHESCCRSLPLPNSTRRLDRYEITSGRLRAFLSAMSAAGGGEPNVRAFAMQYAAAHPESQLGALAADFPGLIDILPDHGGPTGALPLPVHLGAFPMDPINTLDGCYTSTGAYGHATYWQPASDVGAYGVGAAGERVYSREILDEKPVNCVMPILLATFCAWDGGELARTSDYHAIWGTRPVAVGEQSVKIPWETILSIGQFNWRNGHGTACGGLAEWPGGCTTPQPAFYGYPAGGNPANDDSPAIAAPGRFVADVTAIRAGAEGWFDIGGNLMEAAWPNGAVNTGANPVKDVCDTANGEANPTLDCPREAGKAVRYRGDLQHVALVGYSFEGHNRRSEPYLAAEEDDESLLRPADLKPVSFQYGKVGGRCARSAP